MRLLLDHQQNVLITWSISDLHLHKVIEYILIMYAPSLIRSGLYSMALKQPYHNIYSYFYMNTKTGQYTSIPKRQKLISYNDTTYPKSDSALVKIVEKFYISETYQKLYFHILYNDYI